MVHDLIVQTCDVVSLFQKQEAVNETNEEDDKKLKETEEQNLAYASGGEEPTTYDTLSAVTRQVKLEIYPKVKFLSDTGLDYLQPDFVSGTRGKQAVSICERILTCLGRSDYNITQKVRWWVAYRKEIKKSINQFRHASVSSMQKGFVQGEAGFETFLYHVLKLVSFLPDVLKHTLVSSLLIFQPI